MTAHDAEEQAGLRSRVDGAIARAQERLRALQQSRGQWQGVVEAAPNLEAEYVFVNRLLGRDRAEADRRMAERLLSLQGDDGGWALAPGLPGHLSTSVEAYLALKLVGTPADAAALRRAREFIRAQGGLARTGVYTRFWLASFGQCPWWAVPALPVEMILLPPWAPLSIYAFSAWARAMLVPFSLLVLHRPEVRVAPDQRVDELWLRPPTPGDLRMPRSPSWFSRRNFFLALDRTLEALGRIRWKPLRRRAVARAIEWILRHQDSTGQWGGIQPAMVHSVLALHAVGFAKDHPVMVRGVQGIDDLLVQRGEQLVCQPCLTPTWDTALAARALLDAGTPGDDPALARAGEWLCGAQIFRAGDWAVRRPDLDPGGWPFELANDHYPNVDVSAQALLALLELPLVSTPAGRRAIARGVHWVSGLQSRSGGWAAFDTVADAPVLDAVPFPDMEGVTDTASADTTGHVLELLGRVGFGTDFGRVRRAIEFLRATQQSDGSWTGRWGVNAVCGTARALAGVAAVGEDPHAPWVRRAVAWLEAHQNPDGSWGESLASYEDPSRRGVGDGTATQTAWALLALLAVESPQHPAIARGVAWLAAAQQPDGTWDEPQYTGTGVPRRSYLRFELNPTSYALRALGRYRAATEAS
jgi:squalene-hopene/tetraprenyl-beta-curcumene cyclase